MSEIDSYERLEVNNIESGKEIEVSTTTVTIVKNNMDKNIVVALDPDEDGIKILLEPSDSYTITVDEANGETKEFIIRE